MRDPFKISFRHGLAVFLFLILPTWAVVYDLLLRAEHYLSVSEQQALSLSFSFLGGMTASALLTLLGFRFLLPFLALITGLYLFYQGLSSFSQTEFDGFFIAVRFQILALLFTLGWIIGWIWARLRYGAILISLGLLALSIATIIKTQEPQLDAFLRAFFPALFFAAYFLFAAHQIDLARKRQRGYWTFLLGRQLGFSVLMILLLGSVYLVMEKEIEEQIARIGSQGEGGEGSMLTKNEDGTFDLKDYTKLRSALGRSNELLFCARIDNFFEGTDIPNPLYLTAFYYSFFDTLTETFERDPSLPDQDLYSPDPSSIPLFATRADSSIWATGAGDRLRKVVDVEIYGKSLSPKTFLAPHIGYWVQPITIEEDFRSEFKWAYRAKGYASELNSAYFVYNSTDPIIQAFQEHRFELLRDETQRPSMDSAFLAYYTDMPQGQAYVRIGELAREVTSGAKTQVDKVLAIRDYFLSEDEMGQPLFQYTDNPGVPDIPSASKLQYFLFENRKGYCAYYAGATLFLLRALGIPSRIAVGFLTVDRSDKNKGWYWYYADQAHAWVQVYFPGYGWLDFDTTVGNDEAQESPQPDGTPPLQPPKAWFVAHGRLDSLDTARGHVYMHPQSVIHHDREFQLSVTHPIVLDISEAQIKLDSIDIPRDSLAAWISSPAIGVSYREALKKVRPLPHETGSALIRRLPRPIPMDELYIQSQDTVATPKEAESTPPPTETSAPLWPKLLGILGLILLLFFSLPSLITIYLKSRRAFSRNPAAQAFWTHRYLMHRLRIQGIDREEETPLAFAQRLDQTYAWQLTRFMNLYLKTKYSPHAPEGADQAFLEQYIQQFDQNLSRHFPWGSRWRAYLSPWRLWARSSGPSPSPSSTSPEHP